MGTSSMMQAVERQLRREEGLVHLQNCGDFKGTPAGEIAAGDLLAWNYGSVYEVLTVRQASPRFIEISERKYGEPDSETYTRRLRKDRLVVRVEVSGGRFRAV